jgi:hypothetical protein
MKDAPDDRDLQDVPNLEGLSRRRFLLGTLLSPSVIPLLGLAAAPAQQLAATEESLETENNWEGPSTSLARPCVRCSWNLAWPARLSLSRDVSLTPAVGH